MLKSLKDIPYPKLRQLARKRINERKLTIPVWNSPLKFDWMGTPEGLEFWHLIQRENYHKAKKLQPHLFTTPPRSKKQELAWNCGHIIGSIGMAEANLGRVNTMNALIASKVLTNSLADSAQRQKLNSTLRELREKQDDLDQAFQNLQQETRRLHALAKEVLANDNKE